MRRRIAALALAGTLALSGCATGNGYPEGVADQLQNTVMQVTSSAASGDLQAALTALDDLEQRTKDAHAAGDVPDAKYSEIMTAIAAVRAKLEAALQAQGNAPAPAASKGSSGGTSGTSSAGRGSSPAPKDTPKAESTPSPSAQPSTTPSAAPSQQAPTAPATPKATPTPTPPPASTPPASHTPTPTDTTQAPAVSGSGAPGDSGGAKGDTTAVDTTPPAN